MISEETIVAKLKGIGFKDPEIPTVMRDVGQIIYGKVLAAYLPTLPEAERMHITTLRSEEAQQYLTEQAGSIPTFPQAQFDAIHDETWEDYFQSVV
jgi:hypothetical protein